MHYLYTKINLPKMSACARHIILLKKLTILHNTRAIKKVSKNTLSYLQKHDTGSTARSDTYYSLTYASKRGARTAG